MVAHALYRNTADRVRFTATAAANGGDVIAAPDGRLGVVAGLKSVAIGDEVALHLKGEFDFKAKAADTFAAGATGYWDATNKEITSTSSGNTDLVVVVVAKAANETTVRAVMKDQLGV